MVFTSLSVCYLELTQAGKIFNSFISVLDVADAGSHVRLRAKKGDFLLLGWSCNMFLDTLISP